jgi:hypothetical protein
MKTTIESLKQLIFINLQNQTKFEFTFASIRAGDQLL